MLRKIGSIRQLGVQLALEELINSGHDVSKLRALEAFKVSRPHMNDIKAEEG